MSKFKVGEKVRVRKDLVVGQDYKMDNETERHCGFVSGMAHLRGKIVTIAECTLNNRYHIECSGYNWTDEMFEPVCKFKVGDMVIANKEANDHYAHTKQGWIGKVAKIYPSGCFEAQGKNPHGFQCSYLALEPDHFDLYTKDQPSKIVITTDGKTTTAKMYRDKTLVNLESTKCHPHDRFDFEVGARIAFDRLVGKRKEEPQPPKYYNGKVVCVDNERNRTLYTKGKIYQFVDGVLTGDDGTKYRGYGEGIKSFEEWNKLSGSEWLEVVE